MKKKDNHFYLTITKNHRERTLNSGKTPADCLDKLTFLNKTADTDSKTIINKLIYRHEGKDYNCIFVKDQMTNTLSVSKTEGKDTQFEWEKDSK